MYFIYIYMHARARTYICVCGAAHIDIINVIKSGYNKIHENIHLFEIINVL